MSLPQELLGERLNSLEGGGVKARELARFKETEVMDCSELPEHSGAPRAIEGESHVIVPIAQQAPEIPIALVMTARIIVNDVAYLSEDALTEAVERNLSQFAKNLPVRLANIVSHDLSASNGSAFSREPRSTAFAVASDAVRGSAAATPC